MYICHFGFSWAFCCASYKSDTVIYFFFALESYIMYLLMFKWLTLILLTWRIWWAPNNSSRWQMGFNSTFKGLDDNSFSIHRTNVIINELIAWPLKKDTVRFNAQSASFIPDQSTTDLSNRKPASASMSCDSCGARVSDKSYALYIRHFDPRIRRNFSPPLFAMSSFRPLWTHNFRRLSSDFINSIGGETTCFFLLIYRWVSSVTVTVVNEPLQDKVV